MLKRSHLPFDNVRYSPSASSNVNYFLYFVANMKCGLYEIKKTEQMLHMDRVLSKKMFQDQTEVMLDQRGPGPGPGPV